MMLERRIKGPGPCRQCSKRARTSSLLPSRRSTTGTSATTPRTWPCSRRAALLAGKKQTRDFCRDKREFASAPGVTERTIKAWRCDPIMHIRADTASLHAARTSAGGEHDPLLLQTDWNFPFQRKTEVYPSEPDIPANLLPYFTYEFKRAKVKIQPTAVGAPKKKSTNTESL